MESVGKGEEGLVARLRKIQGELVVEVCEAGKLVA